MEQIIKQVAGIDVAKKELVVTMGKMATDLKPKLYARKIFANNPRGFESLIQWVALHTTTAIEVRFIMEATGVYHEQLAYFLDAKQYQLSIVLPSRISNYVRTLEVKTVTDSTSADAIALFGLERHMQLWKKPQKIYKALRQLTRERGQLVVEATAVQNQLHAEQREAEPNAATLKRLQERIAFIDQQETEILKEIKALIKGNEGLKKVVTRLCTIPGIGLLTASIILAETNGFELIKSGRQLTSYTGLDVVEKESGTSVKARPKISKKGNKYLRKAMHYPALAATKHDERFKAIYARIIARHGIKMKAVVAVQRKLLELTYTLFKRQEDYDKNHFLKSAQSPTNQIEVTK
jgi:transposase